MLTEQDTDDRVYEIYEEIRRLSDKAEALVTHVVNHYTEQLDEFVTIVEQTLVDAEHRGVDFDDKMLHRLVLRLPILMYRMTDAVDRAAIESDMAKAVTKAVYAQFYLQSSGTVQARSHTAELHTAEQANVTDLTKHVYGRLKSKLDKADSLFDAIRKVITSRDGERAVFGRDRR